MKKTFLSTIIFCLLVPTLSFAQSSKKNEEFALRLKSQMVYMRNQIEAAKTPAQYEKTITKVSNALLAMGDYDADELNLLRMRLESLKDFEYKPILVSKLTKNIEEESTNWVFFFMCMYSVDCNFPQWFLFTVLFPILEDSEVSSDI